MMMMNSRLAIHESKRCYFGTAQSFFCIGTYRFDTPTLRYTCCCSPHVAMLALFGRPIALKGKATAQCAYGYLFFPFMYTYDINLMYRIARSLIYP